MIFSIANNILSEARWLESPNQSERPADTEIDLLVIHNISLPPGEYGTPCVDQLFCNRLDPNEHEFFAQIADLKVSSHLLIDRQGGVTQYVPFNKKAWHAGESEHGGRINCNDFSIGIELEGSDFEPFTDEQYRSLTGVSNLLLQLYPCLNLDRIVGHSDIAPGRKTDPGPFFDWAKYKSTLNRVATEN